ncbi:hypothetical protein PQE75_gp229 [Bacillus phage vB_BcoS-136]|uniref:Uncharacterized protein n=1 Tax=Bacillus phage vB_BcoS-136 TaxID=2419619 RepID=A0A3G3BVT8_9CAUD|nr:hypothetical protein PQE75_gp229 [Bacillus phage vB_BcoS-136]AYP68250.1 hypothetical protein vBBcoS136_00135 [Bacillus phage vB_BcoS-136]
MSENFTYLSEVYGEFLAKISDYSLLDFSITEDEINEQLFGYLKPAIRKFYKCKSNLNIIEDDVGEKIFESELHPYEIEILVSLMLVEYLKPTILSSETIKQSLSDKDFKIHSQANQLRELSLLYRQLKREAMTMITQYTYFGIEEEKWK